jgi:hypothetical protein
MREHGPGVKLWMASRLLFVALIRNDRHEHFFRVYS